ncbi:MAG: hypothetical protein WD431_15725 [Cyclobacteriaceae bacterium]
MNFNSPNPRSRARPYKGKIGVGQMDITPLSGINNKNWGAASQFTSMGIHKPLYVTCITFQSFNSDKPLILISADLGWWKNMEDEWYVRNYVLENLNLDPSQLMICLTHTHAGPNLNREDKDKPGGHLIEPYLDQIRSACVELIEGCFLEQKTGVLTWEYGKCNLAKNRDLFDRENNRYLVGFNPEMKADDTLLVGRITDEKGNIFASIVNYACHPTTLGWENSKISPDYLGSFREIMEPSTGCPCLFIQGASGDLAPAEQYTGSLSIADKHGRQLAYSCLAVLESMLPPEEELVLDKIVESGAPLAVWKNGKMTTNTNSASEIIEVEVELKPLPTIEELLEETKNCDDPVLNERLVRKLGVRKSVGNGTTTKIPVWVWRLSDCILLGQPNEAYSVFQQTIRERFDSLPIIIGNVVNGHIGYLPPEKLYGENIYSVWQTPYEKGAHEIIVSSILNKLKTIT